MRSLRMRAAGLLAAVAAVVALSTAPARADVVTDWNAHATTALAGQFPTVFTIHMAMVHGAVYDAVNSIDRRYEPYLVRPRARWWFSKDAAAATAAYRVLSDIVTLPDRQAVLDASYAMSMAAIPAGPSKQGGIAVGEVAGWAMIGARTDDGRFGEPGFEVGTGPGEWRPVPPGLGNDANAWVAEVEPFLIKRPSQFRSPGPYDLDSRRYTREFEEVKRLGSVDSSARTADQTDAALFWAEGPLIMTRVARDLSARFRLSIAGNARMFAMQYLTGADSLIGVWDDKKHWLFWRPLTAIRVAGTDGNRATEADPAWLSLVNTPPYPDHSSGLSGVVSGMSEALEDFFGTDRIAFSETSMNPPQSTRSFDSFSEATQEVVDARVWSGIHFRKADEDGARIGKQVSRWRERHYFEAD